MPDSDRPTLCVYRWQATRWQRRRTVAFGSTDTTDLLPGFRLVIDPRAG